MPDGIPKHFAHSLQGRPHEEWHGLEDHLVATAKLAEAFVNSFAPGWGRLAGLWHDAGKYRRGFQARIGADPDAHVNERVDHSSIGALIAVERREPLLAFVIAGHHGGLSNADDLGTRMKEKGALLSEARADGLPRSLEDQPRPSDPEWLLPTADRAALSLWTRFLFSAR
jgi:CRISPR-associated endonuclease/helicase Cas3